MAYVVPARDLSKHLARDAVVQQELRITAGRLKRLASGLLSAHRDVNRSIGDRPHDIEIERRRNVKYGTIDWFVSMTGPAPVSVEYGHHDRKTKRWVGGLYIMTRSAQAMAGIPGI